MNERTSAERQTAAAGERLAAVAKTGRTCEVVLVLRGEIFPPRDARGRWRLRTAHGQTTFEALDLLALTVASRPRDA